MQEPKEQSRPENQNSFPGFLASCKEIAVSVPLCLRGEEMKRQSARCP